MAAPHVDNSMFDAHAQAIEEVRAVSLLQMSAAVRHRDAASGAATEKKGHSALGLRLGVAIGAVGGGAGGLLGGRSFLAGFQGALVGALIGTAGGFGCDMLFRSNLSEEKQDEIIEPVSEKLRRLAVTVMAADKHMEHGNLSADDFEKVEADLQEAKGVLDHFMHDAVESNDLSVFEEEYHHLEEMITENGVMDLLSAEAAAEDKLLITGNDVAGIENGSRGEDLGGGNGTTSAYEGDMIPSDASQLLLFQEIASGNHSWVSAGRPWTGGVVSYCFASDTPATVQHIFEAAAHEYSKAVPCLRFINVGWAAGASATAIQHQKCRKSPAIFVTSNSNEGCYAYVGMIPQFVSQRVQLKDKHCTSLGTVVHELGHALGMAHEQARPDRDRYVRINRQNIQPGMEVNFDMNPGGYAGVPYDFKSIMHYDAFAFAKNRAYPTIQEIGTAAHTATEMGQRIGLSRTDVYQVAQSYVPENPTCSATTLLPKMGCIDSLNNNGDEICAGLTACSAATIERCCACGGGIQVQCYVGSECPHVAKLPPAPGPECIEDVTALWNGAYECAFTNVCAFPVKWQCPSLPCVHKATPGGYFMNTCQGYAQTEICSAKATCKIWKV